MPRECTGRVYRELSRAERCATRPIQARQERKFKEKTPPDGEFLRARSYLPVVLELRDVPVVPLLVPAFIDPPLVAAEPLAPDLPDPMPLVPELVPVVPGEPELMDDPEPLPIVLDPLALPDVLRLPVALEEGVVVAVVEWCDFALDLLFFVFLLLVLFEVVPLPVPVPDVVPLVAAVAPVLPLPLVPGVCALAPVMAAQTSPINR